MTAPIRRPHEYATLDPAVRRELVDLSAADGLPLGTGILHLPPHGDPDVAVVAMHPRVDFARHYLVPYLTTRGLRLPRLPDAPSEQRCRRTPRAAPARRCRRDGVPPRALPEGRVARQLRWRVAVRVLPGAAATPPAARLQRAPSGERVPLGELELPMGDGFVVLAAHLGEGVFLLDRLDPSVVDESNPTAVNPRLDMYDPRNGYRPMRGGRVTVLRRLPRRRSAPAQRARCERIDRAALAACEEAAYFRRKLKEDGPSMAPDERGFMTRLALQRRYLLTYRTLADPRYLDLRLDPSQRPLGSIFSFGRDPIVGNYGEGIGRVMSARGWLSTWSGLSSNAALERTLPQVTVPTLVVAALADTDIYPAECRRAFDASAARDKDYAEVEWADHYLRPVGAEGARLADPKERAAEQVVLPWLRERWPA